MVRVHKNKEKEAQKVSIKNFYYQRLIERVDRFQQRGMRHRRNRNMINVGMIGNSKIFMGVFWWEVEKTQRDLSKKDSLGAGIRKAKKLPEKVANPLIPKAAQKRQQKTASTRIKRHLKLC